MAKARGEQNWVWLDDPSFGSLQRIGSLSHTDREWLSHVHGETVLPGRRLVKNGTLPIFTGLPASLLDLKAEEVHRNRTRFGNVLETFFHGELLKHTSTADGDYHL